MKPEQISPTSVQAQAFKVPSGFTVSLFAEGLGKPRILDVADDGAVFVTRREPGDVVVLRDTNGDGRSDSIRTPVRRPMLHGIAPDGRRAYLASVNDIFGADITNDGTIDNVTRTLQGRHSRGPIDHVGPRPPEGDPAHHYHFQVYALDALLNLPPGADREAVLTAMTGPVVARGDLVGTFQRAQ